LTLKHIDIGGGLGVCYKDETPPSVEEYANSMKPALDHCCINNGKVTVARWLEQINFS
jgi:diaminopimelate decarboxylase